MLRYSPEVGFPTSDLQDNLLAMTSRDLEAAVTDDDRASLNVVTVLETNGTAASGITAYARAHAIDLIVVGTHGRGALKQIVMGSAAERVVRTAPCPVLTVRFPERDFIAPDVLAAVATH